MPVLRCDRQKEGSRLPATADDFVQSKAGDRRDPRAGLDNGVELGRGGKRFKIVGDKLGAGREGLAAAAAASPGA